MSLKKKGTEYTQKQLDDYANVHNPKTETYKKAEENTQKQVEENQKKKNSS